MPEALRTNSLQLRIPEPTLFEHYEVSGCRKITKKTKATYPKLQSPKPQTRYLARLVPVVSAETLKSHSPKHMQSSKVVVSTRRECPGSTSLGCASRDASSGGYFVQGFGGFQDLGFRDLGVCKI